MNIYKLNSFDYICANTPAEAIDVWREEYGIARESIAVFGSIAIENLTPMDTEFLENSYFIRNGIPVTWADVLKESTAPCYWAFVERD